MKKIIFILIAIGLLWNSQNSITSSFDLKTEKVLDLNTSLNDKLSEERFSDNADDERESCGLEYLALNSISKKLLITKLKKEAVDSFSLLNFISPVFTPPPDLS